MRAPECSVGTELVYTLTRCILRYLRDLSLPTQPSDTGRRKRGRPTKTRFIIKYWLTHARSLRHRYPTNKEENFPNIPPSTLLLVSFNSRSIYGREQSIVRFMLDAGVALLAVQEAMLNMNNLPVGLFKSTFYRAHPEGKWGLCLLVHPAWESRAREPPSVGVGAHLTKTNPNILWILVQETFIHCKCLPPKLH